MIAAQQLRIWRHMGLTISRWILQYLMTVYRCIWHFTAIFVWFGIAGTVALITLFALGKKSFSGLLTGRSWCLNSQKPRKIYLWKKMIRLRRSKFSNNYDLVLFNFHHHLTILDILLTYISDLIKLLEWRKQSKYFSHFTSVDTFHMYNFVFILLFFSSENDIELSAQEQKKTIADLKMSFDEKASP